MEAESVTFKYVYVVISATQVGSATKYHCLQLVTLSQK